MTTTHNFQILNASAGTGVSAPPSAAVKRTSFLSSGALVIGLACVTWLVVAYWLAGVFNATAAVKPGIPSDHQSVVNDIARTLPKVVTQLAVANPVVQSSAPAIALADSRPIKKVIAQAIPVATQPKLHVPSSKLAAQNKPTTAADQPKEDSSVNHQCGKWFDRGVVDVKEAGLQAFGTREVQMAGCRIHVGSIVNGEAVVSIDPNAKTITTTKRVVSVITE